MVVAAGGRPPWPGGQSDPGLRPRRALGVEAQAIRRDGGHGCCVHRVAAWLLLGPGGRVPAGQPRAVAGRPGFAIAWRARSRALATALPAGFAKLGWLHAASNLLAVHLHQFFRAVAAGFRATRRRPVDVDGVALEFAVALLRVFAQ